MFLMLSKNAKIVLNTIYTEYRRRIELENMTIDNAVYKGKSKKNSYRKNFFFSYFQFKEISKIIIKTKLNKLKTSEILFLTLLRSNSRAACSDNPRPIRVHV